MNLEVFDKVVVTQERKRIENKRPQGYIFPNLRAERYRDRYRVKQIFSAKSPLRITSLVALTP